VSCAFLSSYFNVLSILKVQDYVLLLYTPLIEDILKIIFKV